MIELKKEVENIVDEATENLLGLIEMDLDEGDWTLAVFELTTRMGATPEEHAEVMGWIDTLISAAVSKMLMGRITQHMEERIG